VARGGRRTGTPGAVYPNRSDLTRTKQPVQTVPGQTYGQAGAQAQAQKIIPLPTQNAGQVPAGGAAAPTPAPPAGPLPGSLTPLSAPTQRPNEPVTHGADAGPGGGSEVLGFNQPDTTNSLLTQLAAQPGAPSAVTRLADYLNAGRR
jgi:hypothetical protein